MRRIFLAGTIGRCTFGGRAWVFALFRLARFRAFPLDLLQAFLGRGRGPGLFLSVYFVGSLSNFTLSSSAQK